PAAAIARRASASIAADPSTAATWRPGRARPSRTGMSAGPQPRSTARPPTNSGNLARKRSTKPWLTAAKSARAYARVPAGFTINSGSRTRSKSAAPDHMSERPRKARTAWPLTLQDGRATERSSNGYVAAARKVQRPAPTPPPLSEPARGVATPDHSITPSPADPPTVRPVYANAPTERGPTMIASPGANTMEVDLRNQGPRV